MNHVPGPWRVLAFGDATYKVERHTHTAHQSIDEQWQPCQWSETTESTARLIAAAPDLLEALRDCLRRIDDADETYGPDHAVTKARAAIAKATGDAK